MKKSLLFLFLGLMAIGLFGAFTAPDEGEWLLTQIAKLPLDGFRKAGLKLSPAEIYTPNATSLTSAIVLLPGGTGSFVSNDGLIITNHHIAFGGIQALSSVEDDYLANGFLAKSRGDELSCPTYSAQVVTNIEDVTAEVLTAVSDTMSADTRSKAIQKKIGEMAKAARNGNEEIDVRISELYNGVQYLKFTFDVIRDVRLVYAPPGSIGVYGGETDNWMWPRHTGDFAFMRAYVAPDGKHAKYSKDNVPYHPKKFLPISNKPLEQGSFAMIMGFPGRTFRYRTADEIKFSRDVSLPTIVDWYQKRMRIMETAGKKDRAVEIQYAAKYRGIANTEKNYVGTLEGMKRSDVVSVRDADEAQFHKFIDTKEELESKYESLLSDIAALNRDYRTFYKKSFYLGQLAGSIDLVRLAGRFGEYAESFQKDSTGAMKPTSKLNLAEQTDDTYKDASVSVDKEQLVALILTAAQLTGNQSVAKVKEIANGKEGTELEALVRKYVDDLYASSKISSASDAKKLAEQPADEIKADPLVKFAREVNAENEELSKRVNNYANEINRLRGEWMHARMAWKGDNMYPDANRTIRFTYGTVKPYIPRDAVNYDYMTSLSGVMEKETGEDPFIVPAKLRQLWEKKDFGSYTDPHVKNDVPVAFLANLDITGGNSGSPVINGSGELIGVAFDGNWEAVVGDYYFQDSLNRTISVDSRYVLFILDKFAEAHDLMKELVIAK